VAGWDSPIPLMRMLVGSRQNPRRIAQRSKRIAPAESTRARFGACRGRVRCLAPQMTDYFRYPVDVTKLTKRQAENDNTCARRGSKEPRDLRAAMRPCIRDSPRSPIGAVGGRSKPTLVSGDQSSGFAPPVDGRSALGSANRRQCSSRPSRTMSRGERSTKWRTVKESELHLRSLTRPFCFEWIRMKKQKVTNRGG
jgi:hypothetical protein